MKYMNNHYGQPKFLRRARCKMPLDIQFFSESSSADGDGGSAGSSESQEVGEHTETPTLEELMAKLTQKDLEYAKLKNAFDTKASALSKAEKQLKAKMSAEEQIEEEKRIADEAKDARIQELELKFRTMDYSKRYMGIGMDEKTAETLSEMTGELADPDKFFSALGKFITASNKSAGENAIQDLIKKNPEIKAGNGDDTKSSLAEEKAVLIGKKTAGANEDILKHYRR